MEIYTYEELKNVTSNNEGEVSFELPNGDIHQSCGQPTFDNSPSNNFSTYSAPIYSDEGKSGGIIGRVEWDIINHESEFEDDACDWDKFTVYMY